MYQYPRPPDTGHPLRPKKITESYTDYTMKGGNPDKFRVSAFSLSLLFRHFPDSLQNMGFGNQRRQKDATVVCLTCDFV